MHLNIIKQGVKPKRNDNLDISYRAYFLDGRLLDTTSDGTELKYSFGEKAQVIDGLNRVISKIGAGGKAEVIIPSILAFGDKGSSSKLVPPSTPLRYVVSIQKDSTAVKI